jgi:hypothetical protein
MKQRKLFGGSEPATGPKSSAASRPLSMFDAAAMAPVQVDLRIAELPPLSGFPLFRKQSLPPPAELVEISRRTKRTAEPRLVMREAQGLRAKLKECRTALAQSKKPCACASKAKKVGSCGCKGH